ncbi:MAG: hypothetical protein KKE16_02680 [Firmicutes bacterium]|nr:hypothetical protein [Bacillota bacterium]
MRIILSRKGFDSNTGGITSPIFENGDMISFPIPENKENKVSDDTFDLLHYNGLNFTNLLCQLGYKQKQRCHIDPDLVKDRRVNRESVENWKAIFGQCDSAATHLDKTIKVREGDIFLFFGNFHCVENHNGIYQKVNKTGDFYKDNDLQVIWGYMQVKDIIRDHEKQKENKWHPHSKPYYIDKKTNIMYVSYNKLTFNKNLDAYGILKFRKDRVLTKENYSKANWIKNPVYDEGSVIGNRNNKSKDKNTSVYYQGQWQELGLEETKECENWAKKIIEE